MAADYAVRKTPSEDGLRALQKRQLIFCALTVFLTKAVERHITIGAARIARQQAAIARLERHEDRLREAIRLLGQFLEIQALHLADRDRLISELRRATTDRRIAQGRFRIAQQREMISRLESRGEDSQSAKDADSDEAARV